MGFVLGLGLGLMDTAFAVAIGVEFQISGTDVTVGVALFLAISFGVLGYLYGTVSEQKEKEKSDGVRIRAQNHEINEARVKLLQNEKLAALGQIASAIAHEVRNPLAIIRSHVQNIAEASDSEEVAGSCGFVIEEIDRLTRVAGSLVSFSRPIEVERSNISLGELFGRAVHLAEPLFEGSGLLFTPVMPTDTAAEIHVDRDLVCQVLIGLIGNATSISERGSVTLETRLDDREVVFSVSDEGPGVPDEIKERVFEPFFTTREGGAGLGLAVARQIVHAHEGKIQIVDRAQGAQFDVHFKRGEHVGEIAA